MNDKKFRELQLVQVKILDEIHKVCVKNNLTYYMWGGTALGAIRHKGFIPWDVDIDVIMPRSDYDKFIEIANKDLDSRYECQTYKNQKHFTSPHILVTLKNSSITFPSDLINKTICRSGIYVDILPLDQVSTDKNERKKHERDIRIIKKIKYYKSARVFSSNNKLEIFIKWIIRNILSLISWQTLNQMQQKVCMRFNNLSDTGLVCSTCSHYKYDKVCMPRKIFGTPKLYDFEGRQYYGPEHITDCLTHLYGDYMKLPPLNIQEEMRNSVVDATWE